MSYLLGVDLGTTFTAAAMADGAEPTMVGLGNRALQIPSVLFLDADGFVVGEAAERRGVVEPDRVVREFKRRLGDHIPLLVGGSPFSAELLTARLLTWVVATSTERLGEAPESVVLTHPANWGPFKMEIFGQVATLADISNVQWVPEPVAAAAQYASRARVETGGKLAIYDLGGGTFDVCVVEKTTQGFRMLGSPDGVEHLGGADLDHALFERVMTGLADRIGGLDPDDPGLAVGLGRLRRDCVEAKEALSSDVTTVVPVSLPGLSTTVRVTRSEFEELIRPALEETVAATRRGLNSAGVDPSDLDGIVLIGGSSRIPLVGEMLQQKLGIPAALDTHPKHDVALGAARLAEAQSIKAAASTAPEPQAPSGPPTAGNQRGPSGSAREASSPTPASAGAAPLDSPLPASRPSARRSGASSSSSRDTVLAGAEVDELDVRPRRSRWPAAAAVAAVLAGAVITTIVVVQTRDTSDTTISSQPSAVLSPSTAPSDVPRAANPLPNNVLLWPREVQANWDIWSITVDGVDSERLTLGQGADTRPVLSADRRSFIYHHEVAAPGSSDSSNTTSPDVEGLHVMGVDGSGDRPLFPTGPSSTLNLARPGWSPDGKYIASASRSSGQPTQLVILSIAGDTMLTIAEAPKLDDPTFTPDGQSVTYWASEPTDLNGGTLMMAPVDGSSGPKVFLPGKPGQDADPAWSPDGSQLTFRRRGKDGHNIWVVNRDGTGLTQLTTAPGDDQDPSWSPDGRRIAFKSARNGEPDIFVMNADGSNQHLVLHNPEADDAPAWTRR